MRPLRAVLDTNIVISALLFKGEVSRIHSLWKKKAFILLASGEMVGEHIRVLAYPKFGLTESEIENIVREELIPYIEPVKIADTMRGSCPDPDDDKFLACAVGGGADVIVSGDSDLLSLKKFKGIPIITAERFLKRFE